MADYVGVMEDGETKELCKRMKLMALFLYS